VANLRKLSRKTTAAAFIAEAPRPRIIAAGKISCCRMKKARRSFAASSSQRNHMTLMWEARAARAIECK
jgi:hypothetical protein